MSNDYSISIQRRHVGAKLPIKTYGLDAGFDLVCMGWSIIWPFQVKDLDTGWNVKIPDGYWGSIKTRSSTFFRRHLLVLEGVIDPTYTGVLSVVVFNPTFIPKIIKPGDRLAQLLICKAHYPRIKTVSSMPVTVRGNNGFGHTDKLK
jgi:dUTP pyrophosphatase